MKPWEPKWFRSPGSLLSRLDIDRELDNWVAQKKVRFLTEEGLPIPCQISHYEGERGWAYLNDVLPGKSLRHDLYEITAEFHNPNRKDSVNGSWDQHVSDMYHGARGGQMTRKLEEGGGKGGGTQATVLPALYKRSVNHIKFAPTSGQKIPIWSRFSLGTRMVRFDKVRGEASANEINIA